MRDSKPGHNRTDRITTDLITTDLRAADLRKADLRRAGLTTRSAGAPGQRTAGPTQVPDSIGQLLRGAREDCRLTTADVAKVTRIPLASVISLENETFDLLPAPVFVRGFIRAYCREVDLEPDEVLGRYDTLLHEQELDDQRAEEGNLGPLLLSGPEVGGGAQRGLQISHVLLLLLALATFIIAYVTAGVPDRQDTPAANEASTTHQTTTTSNQTR